MKTTVEKFFLKRDRQSPSECLTSAPDDLTGEFSGSDVPTDTCKQWRWFEATSGKDSYKRSGLFVRLEKLE